MDNKIPTYSLQNIASLDSIKQNVFFTNSRLDNPRTPLNKHYRSDYFGVSICLSGNATLIADLETYSIEKNSIIAMSPQVVKQWLTMSDDYTTLTLFFKADFLIGNLKQLDFLERFIFFQRNESHGITANDENALNIKNSLLSIQHNLESKNSYFTEIAVHQICVILYQLETQFQSANFSKVVIQTRS
jgi:AraC family transcriptional regulator, transcriptional activator of pobA